MEEIFDIYTRSGQHIGKERRQICHSPNPGFYHKPVWIWIINDKGEVLVQKRAAVKKDDPNKWDMPSAGHVLAGETSIEGAIRETQEELGVPTKESDYKFICEYICDSSYEIAQVYLLIFSLSKTLYPLFSGSLALSINAILSLNTNTPGYISFKRSFNTSFILDSDINPSSKLSFL